MEHERPALFSCDIYPSARLLDGEEDGTTTHQRLLAVAAALQAFVDRRCEEELQGYVWQRERLRIDVVRGGSSVKSNAVEDKPTRLTATMRHGGSVEDEWLAVHLLMLVSASSEFDEAVLAKSCGMSVPNNASPSPGLLIASPLDEDGELLLIEAADVLPKWVQPSNAGGRLWIVCGELRLITPDMHKGDAADDDPAFDQAALVEGKPVRHATALHILRSTIGDTAAPVALAAAIKEQRLSTYPALMWAHDTQHSTLVYLPIVAAKIITRSPQTIAAAAEAMQARDGPLDARRLRNMTTFGEAGEAGKGAKIRAMTSYLVRVRMPRRMYAALLADRYFPPTVFGTPWREAVMRYWDAAEQQEDDAALEQQSVDEAVRAEGRRRDLGCKIACGLELVFAHVKERQRTRPQSLFAGGTGTQAVDEETIRSTPSYARFLASLTSLGYFGTEMRDSYGWKQREQKAIDLWRAQADAGKSEQDDDDGEESYAGRHLAFLLDAVPSAARDRSLPPHVDPAQGEAALSLLEDSNAFLYDVEDERGAGADTAAATDDSAAERAAMQQIAAFSDKLQTFMEGQGDEVGALFQDEEMEEDNDDESDSANDEDARRDEAKQRVAMLSEQDKQHATAGLVPRLADDEWGARPGRKREENALLDPSQGEARAAATGFSRHVRYDGASDSDESVDDEVLRAGDTDEDRMSRARWLGIESDVRQDEERHRQAIEDGDYAGVGEDGDDDSEAGDDGDGPLLGDDDVMGFVEFTRKELGLTTEQFNDILEQRRQRGAYVPEGLVGAQVPHTSKSRGSGGLSSFVAKQTSKGKGKSVAFDDDEPAIRSALASASASPGKTFREQTRENAEKLLRNARTTEAEKQAARARAQEVVRAAEEQHRRMTAKASAAAKVATDDSTTDPFQRLMNAMDAELARHKGGAAAPPTANALNVQDVDREDSDEEMELAESLSAQDAELLERMQHDGNAPASLQVLLQKEREGGGLDALTTVERNVMEGMLRSYEAQGGGAGPVGSMLGRLGLGSLPLNQDGSGARGSSSSTSKR